MSTVYPNGIDDNLTLQTVFDNITDVKADTVNRLRDAILNVEKALGINPQGTYTSTGGVRARLDAMDVTISNLNIQVSNILVDVGVIVSALDGAHMTLGTLVPSGFNPIGITTLQSSMNVTETLDTFNNIMAYLAPAQPLSMQGLSIDAATAIAYANSSAKVADVSGHSLGYFKTGSPAGSAYSFITKTQVFTLTTHTTNDATTGFSDGDKGILALNINNAGTVTTSSFNLFTAFDETYRANSQGVSYSGTTGNASPPLKIVNSNLQIYSVGAFNGFPLWQKGVARINNITLSPGYNYFNFVHTVGSSVRTSNLFELFYDNGAVNPTYPSTPALTVSSSANLNYLSGIKYLTTGDSLQLQATINNAFVNTYLQIPLTYTFTVGIPSSTGDLSTPSTINTSLPAVGPTGTNLVPNSTDSISINRTFNITTTNQQTVNQLATITYSNAYGTTFVSSSAAQNLLINTYNTHASSNKIEAFVDEAYRLLPDINGASGASALYPNDYVGIPPVIPALSGNPGYWDSQAALTNGNAQAFNARLVYPLGTSFNFSSGSYQPAQFSGRDYSGFNNSNTHGGQVYYRAMYDPGIPHSLGTLTLGGLVLLDLTQLPSPNVKVEMKLPGVTGWLDFSKPSPGVPTGVTGEGCRTSSSGSSFGWSVGTFSTATSGYMYILRITLFNTNRQISSLTEAFA